MVSFLCCGPAALGGCMHCMHSCCSKNLAASPMAASQGTHRRARLQVGSCDRLEWVAGVQQQRRAHQHGEAAAGGAGEKKA